MKTFWLISKQSNKSNGMHFLMFHKFTINSIIALILFVDNQNLVTKQTMRT